MRRIMFRSLSFIIAMLLSGCLAGKNAKPQITETRDWGFTPEKVYHWKKQPGIQYIRAARYKYPVDISEEKVSLDVAEMRKHGINCIITEDHRSILSQPHYKPYRMNRSGEKNIEDNIESLNKICTIFQARGIKVIHHLTCVFVPDEYIVENPEETMIDIKTGKPAGERKGRASIACINNPEFKRKFMAALKKILDNTALDGVMLDEVEFIPSRFSCACAECRKKFERDTGIKHPVYNKECWDDLSNPVWRKWLAWRRKCVGDFFKEAGDLIHSKSKNLMYTGVFTSATGEHGRHNVGITLEEQARSFDLFTYEGWGDHPFYGWEYTLAEIKFRQGIINTVPRVKGCLDYQYPDSYDTMEFAWMLNRFSGADTWWHPCYTAPDNAPPLSVWEEMFEDIFANISCAGEICLIYSTEATNNLNNLHNRNWIGWAQALTNLNIPFQALQEIYIGKDQLDKYKLVICPDVACLSRSQFGELMNYVKKGGCLIITGRTSLFDEHGNRRKSSLIPESIIRRENAVSKFGKGKIIYLPETLGHKYYRQRIITKQIPAQIPERDNSVLPQIKNMLSLMYDNPVFKVEKTPDGVVTELFKQSENYLLTMLNVKGIPLKWKSPEFNDKKVFFPKTDEVLKIRLNNKNVKAAYLLSPDYKKPFEVSLIPEKEGYSVQIPAPLTFSALWLHTKGPDFIKKIIDQKK